MSSFISSFGRDFAALRQVAVATPAPDFTGAWSTIEIQPDVFVPQRFTIGVVVQSANDRLYFKLLDDLKKFDCIYQDNFPQRSVREILAHAEEALRRAVHAKTPITEINFDTSSLSLSKTHYTSGRNQEETVDRLYSEVVVLAMQAKKRVATFESIDTTQARALVNTELKRIAKMDYERIVNPSNQGILLEDAGIVRFLDVSMVTTRACGSLTSAVYKTPLTVELNLLKASRDLTTYSRIKGFADIGLFLLMPENDAIPSKDFKRIEDVIGDYEWKLERDGFRVVSHPSPAELAQDIFDWAQKSL